MRILVVHLQSIEVSDGYVVADPIGDKYNIVLETSGDLYLAYEVGGDNFSFLSVDGKMKNISALRRFLFWANIAWLDFYEDPGLPEKIKTWLVMFNDTKKAPSAWIKNLLSRRLARKEEIRSRQIDFSNYDPDLFSAKKHWWSRN